MRGRKKRAGGLNLNTIERNRCVYTSIEEESLRSTTNPEHTHSVYEKSKRSSEPRPTNRRPLVVHANGNSKLDSSCVHKVTFDPATKTSTATYAPRISTCAYSRAVYTYKRRERKREINGFLGISLAGLRPPRTLIRRHVRRYNLTRRGSR